MNRHNIVKHVSNATGKNIPLIDGAKKLDFLKSEVERLFKAGNEIVAISNVLPPNPKYLGMHLCGENYKYGLYANATYETRTWAQDYGVMFVYLMEDTGTEGSTGDNYPGVEKLHEIFSTTTNPHDLIYKTSNPDIKNVVVEDDGQSGEEVELTDQAKVEFSFEDATNEELRDMYKQKFGKFPGGRTKRETIIKKLME